jgi:beta propeller repeat protein
MAKRNLVTLACALAAGAAYGDTLETNEFQITVSSANETTPTLGNDGTSDLVVYTMRVIPPDGTLTPGDIWYQRVAGGAPIGPAIQVTADPTDDELNDVSGDYIVYTAYESTSSMSGTIMVYRISTHERWPVAQVEVAREPRIHGNDVVWVQGPSTAAQVMWYELGWLGTPREARLVAGPVPPCSEVAIGSGYIVWTQRSSGQADVWAFDLLNASRVQITRTAGIDESQPATSGPWITWQTQVQGAASTSIEAMNPSAWDVRSVVRNGAFNMRPSIDGDLIAWESMVTGNYDIFVYRLSTAETFQVTTDPADQYLNDVFGSRIAHVDLRNGSQDVYATELTFVPPPLPVAAAGPDQTVHVGTLVTLDGSGSSDPGGLLPLTYAWRFVSQPGAPAAELSDPAAVSPTFTPFAHGDYVLELTVTNTEGRQASDQVAISTTNSPPLADAGPDQLVLLAGSTVQLDGSQSYDPDGDVLRFAWVFLEKPAGSQAALDVDSRNPAFPTFAADLYGTYVVQLVVVSDGLLASDPSTVQVQAIMTPSAALATVADLQEAVAALPPGALKNENMRNTLNNKLNAVMAKIEAGEYASALQKLENDVLGKTDGCPGSSPPAPDANDWLRSCGDQAVLYPLVLDAIAAVLSLM